jgi:hypothetical protein
MAVGTMMLSPQAAAASSKARVLFQEAKEQWIAEGVVGGGAAENTVLQLAAIDLKGAIQDDRSLAPSYGSAIAAIDDLASIPDASLTPAQQTQAGRDSFAVEKFFNTDPGDSVQAGRWYLKASRAWYSEPALLSRGIVIRPLANAVTDLQHAIRLNAPGSRYMPAVIWDLRDLESAPPSRLKHAEYNRYGAELGFLGVFFSQSFVGKSSVLSAPCIPPTSDQYVDCF